MISGTPLKGASDEARTKLVFEATITFAP